MTTRRPPPGYHADIRRPADRRITLTQVTRLSLWLLYDGDTRPFAQVHLNERGSRQRSPRLTDACALLVLAGETYDFVEVVARLAELPVRDADVVPTLIARARDIVEKKESFNP